LLFPNRQALGQGNLGRARGPVPAGFARERGNYGGRPGMDAELGIISFQDPTHVTISFHCGINLKIIL